MESEEQIELQLGDGTVRRDSIQNVNVIIEFYRYSLRVTFAVIHSAHEVILGIPFLRNLNLMVDFENQKLIFNINGKHEAKPFEHGHYDGTCFRMMNLKGTRSNDEISLNRKKFCKNRESRKIISVVEEMESRNTELKPLDRIRRNLA